VSKRSSATPRRAAIGPYVLLDELGRGGMGAVYLAEHGVLKRRVAIKLLLGEHASETEMRTRFLREARAVATLHHPNLVPVIDYGELDDGTLYFVSELISGESLRARLKRERSLPVDQAAAIAAQIARGLACAHQAGIVHRDLKPSNIMLVDDPEAPFGQRVKILDFGVAKLVGDAEDSELTQTGAMVGTPGFMSPEQCRGTGEIDHRSDVYSLGVVLYLMLAGRPPFVSDGLGEVLAMHIYEPPDPLSTLFEEVPRPLELAVLRCLAKKPEARFRSMAALAGELEQLVPALPEIRLPPARARRDSGPTLLDRPVDAMPLETSIVDAAGSLRTPPGPATAAGERRDPELPATTAPPPRRRRAVAALAVVTAIAVGAAAWIATRDTALESAPSVSPAPSAQPVPNANAFAGGELRPTGDAGPPSDPATATTTVPVPVPATDPVPVPAADPVPVPAPDPAAAADPVPAADPAPPRRAEPPPRRRPRPQRAAPAPAPAPAKPTRETFERPVF
jgi:eukaryotic-like serine/threonine-protein kinase